MNDIFVVPTHQKSIVIIDDEDRDLVLSHMIYWSDAGGSIMCRSILHRDERGGIKISLHRLIMRSIGIHKEYDIDHINRNPRDNRKCNLRFVTHQTNLLNTSKMSKQTSSKYKGVSWHKKAQKWQVHLCMKGKRIYGGIFDSQTEAALKANDLMKELHKEFACLNKI